MVRDAMKVELVRFIYVSFTGGYRAGSLIKHGASRSHCGSYCIAVSVSLTRPTTRHVVAVSRRVESLSGVLHSDGQRGFGVARKTCMWRWKYNV